MKSGGSPPAAPDPQQSAQAQTGSNIATAVANARLNRVNQQTPWGSISYTQGPADANGVPTYSSQIQLSPQQQALLDAQQRQQLQRQQLASQFLGNVSTKPLDLSGLPSLYDRYDEFQQSAQQNQAPAQQAPQMSVQDMMAALEQYLQQQGNPINPAATNMGMAQALRNQGSTQATAPQGGGAANPTFPQGAVNFDSLEAGRNPLGTAGFNIMNGAASPPSELPSNWSQYISSNTPSEGGTTYSIGGSPRLENNGEVMIDGVAYVQVGDQPNSNAFRSRDASQFRYDPEFGVLTPASNMNVQSDFMTDYGPWLLASPAIGAMAGAALGDAGSGAANATTQGGASNFGPGAMDSSSTPWLQGTSTGAPVTDLSVQSTQPGLFQNAYNNWAAGRGIFGNRIASRAAGPILARIIDRKSVV